MRFRYLLAALVLLAVMIAVPLHQSDADDTPDGFLIDMGNGITYWTTPSGSDAVSMAETYAKSLGLEFEKKDNRIVRIGEMAEHPVASLLCSWHLYRWDGTGWTPTTETAYTSGSIAWGFYPDGILPTETPDFKAAWTSFRGSSSSSGVSQSYGTKEVKTPLEWYKTYRTGFVDSSIIIGGKYLYHTTYGEDSTTSDRSHAFLYCLDRTTTETLWRFDLSSGGGQYPVDRDNGYNITSPLIVGDMILINSATTHGEKGQTTFMCLYLLDRYTGELLDTEQIVHDPPTNERGTPIWNGRTFINGGTSPVYDSGAVYFGTSDGRIVAYSVSRTDGLNLLWEFAPNADVDPDGRYIGSRGSFYYFPPTIADIDGTRVLYMGNYEGYIFAVNAATGELIWQKQLIALYEKNKIHPKTPGTVEVITYIGDGRLVVTCTDGGMSPIMGHVVCIDAATGGGPGNADSYWRIDGVTGGTVPVGDSDLIIFATPGQIKCVDDDPSFDSTGLYRLDKEGKTVWRTDCNQISRMTVADGIVYMSEYSAGFFEDGGHVIAKDISDGSIIWSVKLEPYSKSSYSMVAPTVIEGKIYAANDYGAVFCISAVEGKKWDGGGDIILPDGFYHWSWALLIVVIIAALVALVRYY